MLHYIRNLLFPGNPEAAPDDAFYKMVERMAQAAWDQGFKDMPRIYVEHESEAVVEVCGEGSIAVFVTPFGEIEVVPRSIPAQDEAA